MTATGPVTRAENAERQARILHEALTRIAQSPPSALAYSATTIARDALLHAGPPPAP